MYGLLCSLSPVVVNMPLVFRIVVVDKCVRTERAKLSVVELDKAISACS